MPDRKDRVRILRALAEVLATSSQLQSPMQIRRFRSRCEERLGRRLRIPAEASADGLVAAIVKACTEHPGGLHTIAEVCDALHREPGLTSNVHLLAGEWDLISHIDYDDRLVLRRLLPRLPPRHLARLFRTTVDHGDPRRPTWCVSTWHLFVYLCGANAGADGVPPALRFLDLVADHTDPPVSAMLRKHARNIAATWGTPWVAHPPMISTHHAADPPAPALSRGGAKREVATDEEHQSGYLLIMVDFDGLDSNVYLVCAWLQWDPRRQAPVGGGPRRVSRDQLESEIEELVHGAETTWTMDTLAVDLTVEFVLPWGLLNEPVDQFRLEAMSPMPRPVAIPHQVVVRSLDRLQQPKWHRPWHARWRRLVEHPATITWLDASDYNGWQPLEREITINPEVVAVILSAPPRTHDEPSAHDNPGLQELLAAVRNGIPVILWHRADCPSAESEHDAMLQREVRQLCDRGLAELPRLVRQLRLDAWGQPDPQHLGRHLALLWDDHGRMPNGPH